MSSNQVFGGEPNPVDRRGLCLLSLDGGGVRGLSSLYILKRIMTRLDRARQERNLSPLKPCEIFDLIGGTSTGGLIAIMLGRLEMDVDECISAYTKLMKSVFHQQARSIPLSWSGKIRSRFDPAKLRNAVNEVIIGKGFSPMDPFNDGRPRACRVFVCATAKELYGISRIRSYEIPEKDSISATICEAALATSAATSFFDPVLIGERQFVDGALGANNPVEQVEGEASDIWCPQTGDLKPLVKCFISIGTGNPGKKAVEYHVSGFLAKTLKNIATETEQTEERFIGKWRGHMDQKRYFRLNVEQGLQDVGLAEHGEQGKIEQATADYLDHQDRVFRVRDCVENLTGKQNKAEPDLEAVVKNFTHFHIRDRARTAVVLVPYPRNDTFVGRAEILDKLKQQPLKSASQTRVVLFGLGGIGKTQIALEYTYWIQATHPEISVFWVHASNTERFHQSYTSIAIECQIPGYDDPKVNILPLVKRWLESKDRGPWVMVIDNADDAQLFYPSSQKPKNSNNATQEEHLGQYIPECAGGSILVTTRNKQAGVKFAKGRPPVEVPTMNDSETEQLLRANLGGQDVTTDELLTLSYRLERMPLALVQAAAFIEENSITVCEYLRLLDKSDQDLIGLLSEEFETVGRDSSTPRAVAETWILSFEQIQQQDTFAAELLSVMSIFNRQAIPTEFLACYGEEQDQEQRKEIHLQKALGVLKAFSFVTVEKDQSLNIHRLVQLVSRKWLAREERMVFFTDQAVLAVALCYPSGDYENWVTCRKYLPHVYEVLKFEGTASRVAKSSRLVLLSCTGLYLYEQGQWKDAETFLVPALDLSKELLGPDHPKTLATMNNLGLTYGNQARWGEAEKLFSQSLEIEKIKLGTYHPDTLTAMNNLASMCERQGRWEEAEKLETQVLEARKAELGADHPRTLNTMSNLTLTYWKQGRWEEAEKLERWVLEARQTKLGSDHPDTLVSMNNLAFTWKDMGRREDAVGLIETCFTLRQRILGPDHPDTVSTMEALNEWRMQREAPAQEG